MMTVTIANAVNVWNIHFDCFIRLIMLIRLLVVFINTVLPLLYIHCASVNFL